MWLVESGDMEPEGSSGEFGNVEPEGTMADKIV